MLLYGKQLLLINNNAVYWQYFKIYSNYQF
jgi:hypothetical protein